MVRSYKKRALTPVVDRLLSLLDTTGECWEWTGCRKNRRYGSMTVDNKTVAAHRVAYKLFKGDIPTGINVLHRCDNTWCCNPEHLFLGSQLDNVRDMHNKNRANKAFGSKAGRSALTAEQVIEIRQLFPKLNVSYAEMGRRYNVTSNAINFIINRKSWRHI